MIMNFGFCNADFEVGFHPQITQIPQIWKTSAKWRRANLECGGSLGMSDE